MGIDKLVQTRGHLAVVLDRVALEDAGGQAGEARVPDRVDQFVQALVLQQRLERVAVQVSGVL